MCNIDRPALARDNTACYTHIYSPETNDQIHMFTSYRHMENKICV